MNKPYPIPQDRHRIELAVSRSRFIATVTYTPSVKRAREFLGEIRREFPDATHHVHAFCIGYGSGVTQGMSDAGEPPGTAGRPTLRVLEKSGLGDACVVITRYFGGTKLGTGGLVKAYTAACQRVLEDLPRTQKRDTSDLVVIAPYTLHEACRRLIARSFGEVQQEEFAEEVTLHISIEKHRVAEFLSRWEKLTSGRARQIGRPTPRDSGHRDSGQSRNPSGESP